MVQILDHRLAAQPLGGNAVFKTRGFECMPEFPLFFRMILEFSRRAGDSDELGSLESDRMGRSAIDLQKDHVLPVDVAFVEPEVHPGIEKPLEPCFEHFVAFLFASGMERRADEGMRLVFNAPNHMRMALAVESRSIR